jgi:hypothetical protein
LAHSNEWKLDTSFENTAHKTPQQNLKAEIGFTVIAAKARAMLSAAQVPREDWHKMWGEVAKTATALDNLIAATAGLQIPSFVKHLRTFGEAGIMKNMKDGKVGDRGITMMFVGYAEEHTGNCYRMYNPVTLQICELRDIIWMRRMYFTTENCKKTKALPVIAVLITNDVSNEDMKVTEVIKVMLPNYDNGEGKTASAETPKSSSKEGWVTVTMRKVRQVTLTSRYDPATEKMVAWNVMATEVDIDVKKTVDMGYYDILNVTDHDEITIIAVNHNLFFGFANIGAGVGGGFVNTQELRVMTYNEAIKEPDGNCWKEEVENKLCRMIKNKVFKTVLKKDLLPETKIIDGVWAMKKKSSSLR